MEESTTDHLAELAQTLLNKKQIEKAATLVSAMEMLKKSQRNASLAQKVEAIAKELEYAGKTNSDASRDAVLVRQLANDLKEQEIRNDQMSGFVQDVQREVQMLQAPHGRSPPKLDCSSCSLGACVSPGCLLLSIITCLIFGWFLWGGTYLYSTKAADATPAQPKHVAPMILITVALVPMIFLRAKSPEEEQFEHGSERSWMFDDHHIWLRSLDRSLLVVLTILLVLSGNMTMFFLCGFDYFIDIPIAKNETTIVRTETHEKDATIGWMLIFSTWLLTGAIISRWLHIHATYNYMRKLKQGDEEDGGNIELTPIY